MRVLVVIPHYATPDAGHNPDGRVHGSLSPDLTPRVEALTACLSALHVLFDPSRCFIHHQRKIAERVEPAERVDLEVIICTTRGRHLLDRLPVVSPRYYLHHETDAEPLLLGFACHEVLRDRLGAHDYYCYLEDDLILHDPWWFIKLRWFNRVAGDDKLLQPNRYEAGLRDLAAKVYVDGDLRDGVTSGWQDVTDTPALAADVLGVRVEFRRTKNPHSGCFFLNERQMRDWASRPWFGERDLRFIGPLESAATLGILRTFKVYRPAPAHADFLEIRHYGTGYLDRLCPPSR